MVNMPYCGAFRRGSGEMVRRMEALDFQVEIGRGSGHGYEVTWRAPDGSETSGLTRISVSADELRALTARVPEAVLASSAQVRRSATPEERPIQELGRLLFDVLLPDNGRALLAAARHRAVHEERRLRVVLRVRPPELARLPWEFLFDEAQNDYVCPTTPLIRHPQVAAPQRPLRVRPPLRILCMAAAPDDQEPLAVRAEQQRLSSALSGLESEGLIELGWTAGDTWRDLRTALRRGGDAGQWHVFHFIGHGGFDATAQEGALRLSAEGGGSYDLGAENLAMVLEGRPSLRLVVLNACETGRSSAADPFSSVAGALLQRGVPAALAMQFPISDRAAEEFSRTFYEGLAHRLPVDAAVTDARQAIRLALRGTLEWGTPVLYMRSLDGLLFDLTDRGGARSGTARRDTGEIHDMYVQGLAALYTERWDDAVSAFRAVVAQDPGYQSGRVKLDEAIRGRRLASLYAAGTGAADHGHWDAAVEHLGAVVAAEPGYRDAAHRLRQARYEQAVAALRKEITDLHRVSQWQAVLAAGARLAALSPADPDPDGLVAQARRAVQGEKTADETPDTGEEGIAQQDRPPEPPDEGQVPQGSGPDPAWPPPMARGSADSGSAGIRRDPRPEPPGSPSAGAGPESVRRDPWAEKAERPESGGSSPSDAGSEAAAGLGRPLVDRSGAPPQPSSDSTHHQTVFFSEPRGFPLPPDLTLPTDTPLSGPGAHEENPLPPTVSGPLWRTPSWASYPPRPVVPPSVGRRPEPGRDGDVRVSEEPGARSFGFSRDGSRVAVGYQSGRADVLDLGGHVVATLSHTPTRAARLLGGRQGDGVTCVALTPNGAQLATAQYGTVRIWSVTRGVELRQMRLPDDVCAMGFSPLGHKAVFVTTAASAYIWDTGEPAARRRRLRLDVRPYRLAWSADGLRFATAGPAGARVWSIVTGDFSLEVARNSAVLDVDVSPYGARLAIAHGTDGARVLDARSGVEVRRFGSLGPVSLVAFNADGTRLATAGRSGVDVWDTRTGERAAHRRFDSRWFTEALLFGPDGAARAVVREPESAWLIRIGEDEAD